MRYGFFDDANKEYVIERPDTPRGWMNYSGSRNYGSIVTNNAGGYSFYRSPAYGRFVRFWHNAVPYDQPGRYFYVRDMESGDYWSASWQPVSKPLEQYQSICRFGTQYTIITSKYAGIETESTYFVPLEQNFEYWRLKVTNTTDAPRTLRLFTYCEFASEWNIFQDHFNLQYSSYVVTAKMHDNMVRCASLDHLPADPENFANGDQGRWSWLALVGGEVSGFDLDRERFIGNYHSYHNPSVVEQGACTGSTAFGDNACGVLQTDLTLAPGESKELLVLMGVGKAEEEGARIRAEFGSLEKATQLLNELKQWCHARLGFISVDSPDENFNHMVNVRNAYYCLMTFQWSRSCSLIYTGQGRDALGYRDTVQDIVGVVHAIPQEARERLALMITGQNSTGGAMPEVKPYAHHPGAMPPTHPESYRSDDCLWLFNAVPAYVDETGDLAFYQQVLPYADAGEATVYGHLRRALEFNLERLGAHGLPCGLSADWNDCLKLGFHGESIFVTFQLRLGLAVYAGIADLLQQPADAAWARAELERLDQAIQQHAWDGEWFLRAYREDGSVLGAQRCEEGRIFLNPQSWSVISGAATPQQAETAMNSVERLLASEFGISICTPPYVKESAKVVRAVLFNPGQKENGGIFSQIQPWAVMAECLLGHGDRAYRYFNAFMPARYNDQAELREVEPFVHCQSTSSPESQRPGKSHVPWLSGTAAWAYVAATRYILGMTPRVDGLQIDPCIPATWTHFTMRRLFRGREINITVENPDGVQQGVTQLKLNGVALTGNVLPEALLQQTNSVTVVMG